MKVWMGEERFDVVVCTQAHHQRLIGAQWSREGGGAMIENSAPDAGVERLRGALTPVVVVGRDFLAGRLDANSMTSTMVRAVREYYEAEDARNSSDHTGEQVAARSTSDAARREFQELEATLAEVYTCGSGFRAQRCDADCVARTMSQIVHDFGDLAPAHAAR